MKKILVVVDPTTSEQPGIDRAAWLASKTGAALELFVCVYDQFVAPDRKGVASLVTNTRAKLEELAAPLRAEGIEVGVDAAWDRPLDEGIVRKAMASGSDLVVKDTHYQAALKRALFSNTDWNLIRQCPQPLLLVKARVHDEPLRVAAAVDPFHANDKPAALDHLIITTAKSLADITGGELHVLHCFDDRALRAIVVPSAVGPTIPPLIDESAIDRLEASHREAVAELLTDMGIDPAQATVGRGGPAEWLPATAEALDIGVLVTGAVSRGALKRVLVGSTAEQVLDRLPCDLLVVKPAAFETSVPARSDDA